MNVIVSGKNFDVTPAIRDHAEKKVGRLQKFLDFGDELTAKVTMSVERDRHIVEVTIPIDGMILRGEEVTGDMYASVDLVTEKLERQIEKYKTRLARRIKQATPEPAAEEESIAERVVRFKTFPAKPMALEEALLQMNLLGHDFFAFRDAETEEINVVYRRHDGDYGLLQPE